MLNRASVLLLASVLAEAQDSAGGLLRHLSVANLKSSGTTTINAMKTDSDGNIYVAGTTASFDLPVKNAAQPALGERVLLRSNDRGLTWTELPNSAGAGNVIAFAVHPVNPSILFRVTAAGIHKSVDAGRTWRLTDELPLPTYGAPEILLDPADPQKMYAGSPNFSSTVMTSSDGGESWRQRRLPDGGWSRSFWVDPTGTGVVVAGRSISRDQGASWVEMRLPETRFMVTIPDPTRRGWIFAYTNVGASGALYLSTDWGATWTERSLPIREGGLRPAVDSLVFDPDNAGTIHVRAVGERYITTNDGIAWRNTGRSGSSEGFVSLSRRCEGGGLFSSATSFLDFSNTSSAQSLTRIQQLAAGPDCSLYAVRQLTSDAFVAKWSRDGRELLWATYLGGMNGDHTTALALDNRGNVYVAGVTASPDFPNAPPRAYAEGSSLMFVSKLDADGRLIYSSTAGADFRDFPRALAVNESGEAHLAGWTDSQTFPTTPGVVGSTYPGPGSAFAVKFGSDGAMIYSTYVASIGEATRIYTNINTYERSVAATALPDGSLLLGGYGGMLVRLSSDGATLTRLLSQPGRIVAIERNTNGDLYVAGARQSGTRSTNCLAGTAFGGIQNYIAAADVFVRKVNPVDGSREWQSDLNGSCASWPESMAISPSGEVFLGIYGYAEFPVVQPLLLNGYCSRGIVARLSANGGKLLQSTPVDQCQQSGHIVASSPDGAVYVASNFGGNGIFRIPRAEPRDIQIDSVVDALSGAFARVTPGRLLYLAVRGVTVEIADVGLNHSGHLPLELAGVRVYMDDQPVGIFRVSPQGVICAVPRDLANKVAVLVRISNRTGASSEPLVFPTEPFPSLSLLTKAFPEPPARNVPVDLNVRNADGTLNSFANPAAIGSTVTLFATGVPRDRNVQLTWNPPPPQRSQLTPALSAPAEPMPGFIEDLWAIRFRIPDSPGVSGSTRKTLNGYGIYIR